MGRTCVEDRRKNPIVQIRNDAEWCGDDDVDERQLVGRLLKREVVVEPDDASFAVLDFGTVVIVRLEMAMDDGVRVVRVAVVHMLGRNGEGNRHPRREGERNDYAATPGRHARIMGVPAPCRQMAPARHS